MEVYYDFTPKIPTEDEILKLSGVEQAVKKYVLKTGMEKLLPIVYEDDSIYVFSKPNGFSSQGGSKISISVDHDTTGLMVVAKNRPVAAALSESFKNNEISKKYVAVLLGHPNPPFGKIDKPLVKAVIRGRETVMISGASDSYFSDYNNNKNSKKLPSENLTKPQSATTEYKTIFAGYDPNVTNL
ncbi:Ribosomal large subunit pseudouridine synthase C [Smittium culicis]|uniref:21S rRNA pseudouridine(2819) synthase n=1 Tax=Smittium culicis TaxID=133412 RepID=A0A1R1Y2F3_9FUNG|nr:Ribosomal large subunit pseudouridine synthase C [Smittium culicis]